MTYLQALRRFLEEHFPGQVSTQQECTCGQENHVRVIFFRVNGQPATAVIPESAGLSALELSDVIGGRVERITLAELDAIFADTELGHMQPFENPFGTHVFLDEALGACEQLVFCPRMFFGQRGQCFRVPVKGFKELTHARVLPLSSVCVIDTDAWAV